MAPSPTPSHPPQVLENWREIPVISHYCEGQPGWEIVSALQSPKL